MIFIPNEQAKDNGGKKKLPVTIFIYLYSLLVGFDSLLSQYCI